MSEAKVRVLPADVYDALELSAEAFGGIGREWYTDMRDPLCAYGHAAFACDADPFDGMVTEIGRAISAAGITSTANDEAVLAIAGRHSRPTDRVSFADWCNELGVVRGK